MPEGQSLEFSGVTKRFGAITAVAGLTARVEPGVVTGFLGPNGAGKTTTLRILLGLVRATDGSATIGGVPYARLENPLQTVGAVLEASSFHPGRSAANHLAVYAHAAGIARSRVDEVLGLVGLADAAGRKVGGYSLGMRQRLGLAYALLGDPGVLVLDEPSNGLDPEGIKWMRGFLRQLAREGRTVLISSHVLAEVQQTVDALLVIAQGRLVFQGGLDELTDPSEYATVVDAPDRAALVSALGESGVEFEVLRSGLTLRGVDPAWVGEIAASAGVALSSLQRRGPALEEVFLDLVNGTRVHASAGGAAPFAPIEEVAPESAAIEDPAAELAAEPGADIAADVAADEVTAQEVAVAAGAGAGAAVAASTTDAAPAAAATYAVASTGVINIIPPDESEPDTGAEAAPLAEPEPEPEPEPVAEDGPEPEVAAEAGTESASDPEYEAESESAPETEPEPEAASEEDRPWEDYVKTDSDVEADAFFAAFTDAEGPEDAPPPDDAEPDHAHGDDEGGEQR